MVPATKPPSARPSARTLPPRKTPVVLLGPQRFDPTLADAIESVGLGRGTSMIATITAGWQERERDDADLNEHLGHKTINLELYRRAEEVWKADPELHAAHRARQELLRHKQDFYRIRLEHELEAAHVIRQRKAPPEVLAAEHSASIDVIRELDNYHLAQCAKIRVEYEAKMKPLRRRAVLDHRKELGKILDGVEGLAIAGGHVATLLNRLELFGIAELLGDKPVFAWSAGAMAVSERVVLFHDDPPQGPGAVEILDRGLSLCRGVLCFPQPETRLKLDDRDRVELLVRRLAPATLVTLTNRSHITWDRGVLYRPFDVQRLHEDGTVEQLGERQSHTPSERAQKAQA